jgi:hypothetical protein
MREDAQAKATRILLEGRLMVIRVDHSGVLALVRGDSASVCTVAYADGRWSCSCPALSHCSHATAVARVVTPPGSWAVQADLFALVGGRS